MPCDTAPDAQVDPKAAQELAHEIDHLGDVYGAH